jgi:diadenosine tetraphosphate (Ap4A) HIT family hydrolase
MPVPLSDAVLGCELCESPGGRIVWQDARWRVVRVDDAEFPGFYRVVSVSHVAEFSDLLAPERARCMGLVTTVERVLRAELSPTKINLASLGNMVPHLHWHVIARFDWDSHFPQPVWGAAQRVPQSAARERLATEMAGLDDAVRDALLRLA